jgi:hypothetical protein
MFLNTRDSTWTVRFVRGGLRVGHDILVIDTSISASQQVHRRRRDGWIVTAALLLIVGITLLTISTRVVWGARSVASPSLTTTPSPIALTVKAQQPPPPPPTTFSPISATPVSASPTTPPPTVETVLSTYVAVPTYAAAPEAPAGDSNTISLVTTFSGLASSVLGLVAAFVSLRARGRRPEGGAS